VFRTPVGVVGTSDEGSDIAMDLFSERTTSLPTETRVSAQRIVCNL